MPCRGISTVKLKLCIAYSQPILASHFTLLCATHQLSCSQSHARARIKRASQTGYARHTSFSDSIVTNCVGRGGAHVSARSHRAAPASPCAHLHESRLVPRVPRCGAGDLHQLAALLKEYPQLLRREAAREQRVQNPDRRQLVHVSCAACCQGRQYLPPPQTHHRSVRRLRRSRREAQR